MHKGRSSSAYHSEIERFVQWCDFNHLVLNVKKTEKMVWDPKAVGDLRPVVIHNEPITQVSSYKYLGVHLDNTLSWKAHVQGLCSRLQQRLYFLRRLRAFGVDQKFMLLFYHAVLESIMRYGITAWYGNLTVQSKSQIARLVQTAMKIMGVKKHPSLQNIYEQSIIRQAKTIVSDPTHILHPELQLLPSGRRFRVPRSRLNRYKHSFLPMSIKLLNIHMK